MNCGQCQTANDSEAAFCAHCGARLVPAGAPAGASTYPAPGAPAGSGGASGYGPPAGSGGAPGYGPPAGYGTPPGTGYGTPPGTGFGTPPGAGFGPASGYPQGQSGPYGGRLSALPPVSFDLARLSTVDKVVAGGTLVTMISLWLPWFSASYSSLGTTVAGSVSGTGYHGWLWLEFLLALLLIAYLAARTAWDQLPFRLPVQHDVLLIAGTGLQFLLIVIGFFAMPSTGGLAGYSISWDFGAFLALIASVVAAGPVIYPAARSFRDSRRAGTAPRP